MNRRSRREQGVLANPILIGALTVLATIVAVTLAYKANNGLPFVPKYTLQRADPRRERADARRRGAHGRRAGRDRRQGHSRRATPPAQPIALLDLKLNKDVQPLPVDSTFDVRLKGAIGLKYLEVDPGTSSQHVARRRDGAAQRSRAPRSTSTRCCRCSTRRRASAWRRSTIGFSDALAGRGNDINDAIGAFLPLRHATSARWPATWRPPKTDLGGFFRGLESFSRRAGAGGPDAGRPVREPRHDVHARWRRSRCRSCRTGSPRRRRRSAAVIADSPSAAGVPPRHRRPVRRAAPRVRDAPAERAGARRRVRRRDHEPARHDRARPAPAQPLPAPRRPTAQTPAVNAGLDRLTLTAQEPALAARVPDAGPVDVQLRDAVPAQHREHAVRADRQPARRCASTSS